MIGYACSVMGSWPLDYGQSREIDGHVVLKKPTEEVDVSGLVMRRRESVGLCGSFHIFFSFGFMDSRCDCDTWRIW